MKSGLFALVIIMCELKEEGADLNSSARIFSPVTDAEAFASTEKDIDLVTFGQVKKNDHIN